MWAYLEHELECEAAAEFEVHLETCQRCCGELEFSRHLREMVAEGEGVARAARAPTEDRDPVLDPADDSDRDR